MPMSGYQLVLISFFVSVDFYSQLSRNVNIFGVACLDASNFKQ